MERAIEIITMVIGSAEENFLHSVESSGLTARQMSYLDAIHRLGNPNPGEIAAKLDLSKPSVTAIISKLATLGYLRKVASDKDRRGYHVHLTEKARKLVHEHEDVHRRIADAFISCLNPVETQALVRIMGKVVQKLA